MAKDRIIVALDVDSLDKATELVKQLSPYVGCFKVGLELLTAVGAPRVVKAIQDLGGEIFFDGKFHDIPNTIAGATKAVAQMGVKMFDIHASNGPAAIRAAAAHKGHAKLIAVTVLTSHDETGARSIFGNSHSDKVVQFAREAAAAGADGVVCSPLELKLLAPIPELAKFWKVTPGVRPAWAAANDQKRILTPAEAIRSGATHLVIGRPMTSPPSEIGGPVEAAKRILAEIEEVA